MKKEIQTNTGFTSWARRRGGLQGKYQNMERPISGLALTVVFECAVRNRKETSVRALGLRVVCGVVSDDWKNGD